MADPIKASESAVHVAVVTSRWTAPWLDTLELANEFCARFALVLAVAVVEFVGTWLLGLLAPLLDQVAWASFVIDLLVKAFDVVFLAEAAAIAAWGAYRVVKKRIDGAEQA